MHGLERVPSDIIPDVADIELRSRDDEFDDVKRDAVDAVRGDLGREADGSDVRLGADDPADPAYR